MCHQGVAGPCVGFSEPAPFESALGVTPEGGKDRVSSWEAGTERRKERIIFTYNPIRLPAPSTGQTQVRARQQSQVPPQAPPRHLYMLPPWLMPTPRYHARRQDFHGQ